ncbi:MAG: D-aminoacyl-tRNA deacylase [Angelakisella sp.]|nr:D-aminoacyl-tRNA deacylase [Angelakisella sp.]
MRAVLQRVSRAEVVIEGETTANAREGLLILLGITHTDTPELAEYLAKKCSELRIFTDENDKLNLSVQDVGGDIVVVSNFTLYASCAKGRRPDFLRAAKPDMAIPLYEHFVEQLRQLSGLKVETGVFGADMAVSLTNDGPITIILDTDEMGR